MTAAARLGILGGTLDPVHAGHIETALAARRLLGLDRVLLMPSRVPPHRLSEPEASAFHRFAMTALAIQDADGLEASDFELAREGLSYTSDTLQRLHDLGFRPLQIFFITGADAFAEIETWHRYPEVLDLAHFVVVARPGFDLRRAAEAVPAVADRVAEASPSVAAARRQPSVFLANVATPDVSSTAIRTRLREGRSITGLVPPAVEAHILRHGLYAGESPALGTPTPNPAADHLHGQD